MLLEETTQARVQREKEVTKELGENQGEMGRQEKMAPPEIMVKMGEEVHQENRVSEEIQETVAWRGFQDL